jgi:hypothetical protein
LTKRTNTEKEALDSHLESLVAQLSLEEFLSAQEDLYGVSKPNLEESNRQTVEAARRAVQGQPMDNRQFVPPKIVAASNNTSNVSVVIPCDDDILFGQGWKLHPGNEKFQKLLDQLQDQHEAADKDGKIKISLIAVKSMHGTGSRFLRFNDATGEWQEVPYRDAHDKAARTFRNRRRYGKGLLYGHGKGLRYEKKK